MSNIFHAVIGSGSCGNSYVFFDGKTSILIDQGYSFSHFKQKFATLNIPINSIEAIFMTHFHPDHCHGMKLTSTKLNAKIYISNEAIEKENTLFNKYAFNKLKEMNFNINEEIEIGDFHITSFQTFHDSGGSVGYYIENNGDRITLITDTGTTSDEMANYANKSNILFLESNYDENLLMNGRYPYKLKKRVLSDWGHLSNEQALNFVKDSNFNGEYLYLIHLSDRNNDVEIVDNLFKNNIDIPNIITCPRGQVVNVMEKNINGKKN